MFRQQSMPPALSTGRTSARRRSGLVAAIGVALLGASLCAAVPAAAAPGAAPAAAPVSAPSAQEQQAAAAASTGPGPITPLPAVDPGTTGSAKVADRSSPALTPIAPLPAINAGPDGAPSVPTAPVPQRLPVAPSPVTLPSLPGQQLIDTTASEALTTMTAAGQATAGKPALDATKLQPQVASAQFGNPLDPATLAQLAAALKSGNIPPPLPVDPLALLQKLPNGLPQITYRVCSKSATKPTSCSITLPIGVPALVNVTGDGSAASPDATPDLLVDVLPAASVTSIVTAVTTLLDNQKLLKNAQDTLTELLRLILDPTYLAAHPEALERITNLRSLIGDLTDTVQRDLNALLSAVNLGLALLSVRLPTSEVAADKPLRAHVWAVYDIPGYKRLSIGYDGLTRGAGLSKATLGIFTFAPADAARGIYDLRGELLNTGPAASLAVTASYASITQDDAGTPFDPTAVSARFSPVPGIFSAHARIDPVGDPRTTTVDTASNVSTALDALVVSNRDRSSPPADQFTQVQISALPKTMTATLTQPAAGGSATVRYQAAAAIPAMVFANYTYRDTTLRNALRVAAKTVPASFTAAFTSGDDNTSLSYSAPTVMSSLAGAFYDDTATISGVTAPLVACASITTLPTSLTALFDRATRHVRFAADRAVGAITLQLSFKLGGYAPLTGDHVTFLRSGAAFGVDAVITGLQLVDAYYDTHPRLTTTFSPGGQAFTTVAIIDAVTKVRVDVSNLPPSLTADLDNANRTVTYKASKVVTSIRASYVNTTTGPSIVAAIANLPTSVVATYDLGPAPRVHYVSSSSVSRAELFVSPDGVETVDPNADQYLSTALTAIPTTVDVLVDFPNRHVEGNSSAALGSVTAAARFPVAGRNWTATGALTGVPARFTVDFAGGSYSFKALSGPLSSGRLTVSNHGVPDEPTSPAHVALHYDEVSGDLDASAAITALTEVGYSKVDGTQSLVLKADVGTTPMAVDVDAVLAANGVADTRFAVSGFVTGLPTNLTASYGGGKLTYKADKSVGLNLGLRVGKIAALAGLGTPLPANGVALTARGCRPGPGCATDTGPFCTVFTACAGVVANVVLAGLPTSLVVDGSARTVSLTGYKPGSTPLTGYLHLAGGLLAGFTDLEALATLSGLPSSLDLTVGPFTFSGAGFDARYTASAALGSLTLAANAVRPDGSFPVLRAKASITSLPRSMRITGTFGGTTHLTVANSASVSRAALTVTSASTGYLQGALTGVPASVDYLLDVPNRHTEATMSAALGGIDLLAHVPVGGRTWSAFAKVTTIPGRFTADFADGAFAFNALSGALGSAEVAVTNHDGATVPDQADYLAVHYDAGSGDVDAGASIHSLSSVSYSKSAAGNQSFALAMGAATIALDADLRLAGDLRLFAGGTVTTPANVTITSSNGHIVYTADRSMAIRLSVGVGKTAALDGLAVPLYAQGVAVRAAGCSGAGCASDSSVFCTVFSRCFGAAANIVIPKAPTKVDIDPAAGTTTIGGFVPTGDLVAYVQLDNLIAALPRVRAKATLSGLPTTSFGITVGPIGNSRTDPTTISAEYAATAAVGSLRVDADATTTSDFGTVRGRLIAATLPKTFSASGKFGSQTHIHVGNSAAISTLSVQATATLSGSPSSGLVRFTDVPATLDLDLSGQSAGAGFAAPQVTYSAGADTLDGLAQLETNFVRNVGPASVGSKGGYVRFTNLGRKTTVALSSDRRVRITSAPATGSFEVGASMSLPTAIPDTTLDEVLGDYLGGFFTARLQGHYGVAPSSIDNLSLAATSVNSVVLAPSASPFGLPAGVGFLYPAVTGSYGTLVLGASGVNLNPNADLTFRVDRKVGPDAVNETVSLRPTSSIVFHKYDNNGPSYLDTKFQLEVGPADLVCLKVKVNPRPTGTGANQLTLSSSDGPQLVSFVDAGDQVPDYILDLGATFFSPFDNARHDVEFDSVGSC